MTRNICKYKYIVRKTANREGVSIFAALTLFKYLTFKAVWNHLGTIAYGENGIHLFRHYPNCFPPVHVFWRKKMAVKDIKKIQNHFPTESGEPEIDLGRIV